MTSFEPVTDFDNLTVQTSASVTNPNWSTFPRTNSSINNCFNEHKVRKTTDVVCRDLTKLLFAILTDKNEVLKEVQECIFRDVVEHL